MTVKPLLLTTLIGSTIVVYAAGFARAQQNAVTPISRAPLNRNFSAFKRAPDAKAGFAHAIPAVDLNVVAANIADEMRTNPKLQGAWLYVEPDDQRDPGVATRIFRFRRVFDRRRAAIQSQEMSRIITSWLPSGNYSINVAQDAFFPVSELLADLQDQIDLQPSLAGSMISGVYFEESQSGGSLNLVLRGRISNEPQVEQIERFCTAIMNRNPVWLRAGVHPSTRKTDDLTVVSPSGLNASLFFAEGLQNFWKAQYREASRAFQQATLESPANLQYHYWRVVSDLSLGNRQRASMRMENVARAFGVEPLSQQRAAISRSMERIQGPLRRDLRDIEMQAVLKVSRTKKGRLPVKAALSSRRNDGDFVRAGVGSQSKVTLN